MTNIESRVTRVCTFTPVAFSHLKNSQLAYQLKADELEPGRAVTNSETLGRILCAHSRLGLAAARRDLTIDDLCTALWLGDLVVSRPAEGKL
ncbi:MULTISPECIES: hypothetical protein [Polaromonas]|uniref:hypothetical protein n=1 Tax=Polaromonas TaxID=52972 RepID=UPI00352B0554